MRTANGRKFKPLFAALVVDLDGRVNLNVHGNVRGRNGQGRPVHASNQGWGAWEVNLGRVLTRQANGAAEWPNLLLGNAAAGQVGRYGPDGSPGAAGSVAPFAQFFHSYGQIDFDGCQVRNGILVPTLNPFLLPAGNKPLGAFPTYPTGYDNGSGTVPQGERRNHPSLYNFDAPQSDDRPFAAADLADLLLYGSGGGTLLGLCPQNFADPRTRGSVTTHSADFDTPGAAPWLYDPSQSAYAVAPGARDQAPAGPPLPFPPLALRNSPVPQYSDFGAPGLPASSPGVGCALPRGGAGPRRSESTADALPAADPADAPDVHAAFRYAGPGRPVSAGPARAAATRRRRLQPAAASGRCAAFGRHSRQADSGGTGGARWLAQLAVNIVDFIDEDDISTPFNFYTVGDTHFAPGFDPGALQRTGTPPAPDPTLPLLGLRHGVAARRAQRSAGGISGSGSDQNNTRLDRGTDLGRVVQSAAGCRGIVAPAAGRLPCFFPDGRRTGRCHRQETGVCTLSGGARHRTGNPSEQRQRPGAPATVRTATTDADFAAAVSQVNGQPQPAPGGLAAGSFFLLGSARRRRATTPSPQRRAGPCRPKRRC